jgi:hypothetical protein
VNPNSKNPAFVPADRATLAQHEKSSSPPGFLAYLCSTVLRFDPALLAFLLLSCVVVM